MAATNALPAIRSLADCVSYEHTVAPFYGQFKALPQEVYAHISDPTALKEIYAQTNPLVTALAISIAIVPFFLVAAEVNRNYSQIDRFWSLLPTVYNAHYTYWAHLTGLPTHRMDTLLAFSGIWSVCSSFLRAFPFPS